MTWFEGVDWWQTYTQRYVSDYSDLYLVVSSIKFNLDTFEALTAANTSQTSWLDSQWPQSWIIDPTKDARMGATDTTAQGIRVYGSLAYLERLIDNNASSGLWYFFVSSQAYAVGSASPNSAVKISLLFMAIVVFVNLAKAGAMLLVLLDSNQSYLVTCGDAVSSFLEHPDWDTEGYCVARKEEIVGFPAKSVRFAQGGYITVEEARSAGGYTWRPRRLRWGSAIRTTRRMATTLM